MSGSSFAASLRHAAGVCRCRHLDDGQQAHDASSGGAESGAPAANRTFAFPTTTRKYERSRPFRIDHIALDLALDVDKKRVEGTATLRLHRVDEQATTIELDAIAFEVTRITIAGERARYTYDDATLTIEIPRSLASFDLVIAYAATPKRGLYFLAPDEHVLDRPKQVWSQCQDEDARYWIPCHDKPHVKQTTELKIQVPRDWFALSNGTLVASEKREGGAFFHWKQDKPHSSYLISLAAGEFAVLEGASPAKGARKGAGELAVTYYVPKGREADGARTFERTPAMIALFERKTGVKYPWAKYAQIVVHDFIFGGMENTSATTMYEHILLDERAAIDVDMDGLVAHELAHQWFGDYVTCRDWSEGWLNEGWATYMELVWKDEGTEPGAGRDEYDYALKGEFDIYLQEDAGRYRRPIVSRDYEQPIDLFDRHLYQKGACVLHALRRAVGDKAFWSGVSSYLQAHALSVVESRDLQRALEASSGRSLDRIFDAFVHGGGHPELEVTVERDRGGEDGAPQLVVGIRQTQKVDETTRLYEGPLVLEIAETGGKTRRETIHLRAAKDTYVLDAKDASFVVIDPDGDLLAAIELKVPSDMLRAQLAGGATARARWLAAIALGKRDDVKTVDALGKALADEAEFWAVRAESAEALGEIRGERAFDLLKKAVKTPHAKVRRAVVRAIGRFKTSAAAEVLKPVALKDRSYLVESDAARALGATRQASGFDTLVEVLDRASWADVVRAGAADGLASLRDDRAIPHLSARTAYGHDSPGRRACLLALARLDTSRKTRELLEERLDDVDVYVRATAVRGLELIGDVKARPALTARLEREDAGTVRRRLREALRDLTSGREAELRRVKDELDKVRDEGHEVRARLAKLEARLGEETPPEGASGGSSARGSSKSGSSKKSASSKLGKPARGGGKAVKGMGRAAAAARGGGTERKM